MSHTPRLAADIQTALKPELAQLDSALARVPREGSMAARISWWCEASLALSIAAERGPTFELDPYGNGRYNGFENSFRSGQNSSRAAGWVTMVAKSAIDAQTRGRQGRAVIDPEMALELHFSTMSNVLDDERTGRFRVRDVQIRDPRVKKIVSIGTSPAEIQGEMEAWARGHSLSAMGHVHPVIRSGLAHLAYAKIHPFPDGNGRTGRVMIAGMHAEQKMPALPFPVIFERNREPYLGEMTDAIASKEPLAYMRWYVNAMTDAANLTQRLEPRLHDLVNRMAERVTDEKSKPPITAEEARNISLSIVERPILTAADISERANVTERKAREALYRLEQDKQLLTRRSVLGDLQFFVCYDAKNELVQEYLQTRDLDVTKARQAPERQTKHAVNAASELASPQRSTPNLRLVPKQDDGLEM